MEITPSPTPQNHESTPPQDTGNAPHMDVSDPRDSKGGAGFQQADDGRRGGRRLVRWASAISWGRTAADPPKKDLHGARPGEGGVATACRAVVDAGDDPSPSGGKMRRSASDHSDGGNFTALDGELFKAPTLRNRFRPSSRAKKWAASPTAGGRAGKNCDGAAGKHSGTGTVGGGILYRGCQFLGNLALRVVQYAKMMAAIAALSMAAFGALLTGCCLYLLVRPWSRTSYRRLLCSQLAAPLVDSAMLLLPRTRVRITGDSDMLDRLCPCVIVSNTLPGHSFLGLDWWAILVVARAVGAHGFVKVLVSERLMRTPVLGWILRILEFPELGGCYQTNRDRVTRCLASFGRDSVLAGASGVPYIFLHFPEGDTLNQESLARSLEFARREGRPELTRLLVPHIRALSACLEGLYPAKPVVYDITLAAEGYQGEVPRGSPPSPWQILCALARGRASDLFASRATNTGNPGIEACERVCDGCSGCWGGGANCTHVEPSGLCHTTGAAARVSSSAVGGVADSGEGDKSRVRMSVAGGGDRGLPVGTSVGRVSADRADDAGGVGIGFDAREAGAGEGAAETWGRGCQDIHVRIKRYSVDEVVGNTCWLDNRWSEKERLLDYFSRHKGFPSDGRGFPSRRILDTRGDQFEGSAMALVRLSAMVLLVPLLSLAAVPLLLATSVATLVARVISAAIGVMARLVLPGRAVRRARLRPGREEDDEEGYHSGTHSAPTTPWWSGPSTPLNTPEAGAVMEIPFVGAAPARGGGVASNQNLSSS